MIDPPPSRQSPHSFSAFDIRRLDISAAYESSLHIDIPRSCYIQRNSRNSCPRNNTVLSLIIITLQSSYSDDKRSTCAYCCIACLIRVCLNSRPLYILHSLRVSCKAAYMLCIRADVLLVRKRARKNISPFTCIQSKVQYKKRNACRLNNKNISF